MPPLRRAGRAWQIQPAEFVKPFPSHAPCGDKLLTICTPYFNLPAVPAEYYSAVRATERKVEIAAINRANDFTFLAAMSRARRLLARYLALYETPAPLPSRLQYYVNTDQLVVRLWKDDDNTYHLKGMWVDDKWMLPPATT